MIAKVHSMHKNLFKMYSSHTYLYLFAAKSVTVFVCGSERALWLEIYFFSITSADSERNRFTQKCIRSVDYFTDGFALKKGILVVVGIGGITRWIFFFFQLREMSKCDTITLY